MRNEIQLVMMDTIKTIFTNFKLVLTRSTYLKCNSIRRSTFSWSDSVNLIKILDLWDPLQFLNSEATIDTTCSSCCSTLTPFRFCFLGVFMNNGKIVLKPRTSTNLLQLSFPSDPDSAWFSTFNAPFLKFVSSIYYTYILLIFEVIKSWMTNKPSILYNVQPTLPGWFFLPQH